MAAQLKFIRPLPDPDFIPLEETPAESKQDSDVDPQENATKVEPENERKDQECSDSNNRNNSTEEICMDPRGNFLNEGDDDKEELLFRKQLEVKRHKWNIVKNVTIICLAFLLNFTAFQSLQNLQSSLNREEGLGTISLSLVYGSLLIGCLFLTQPIMRLVGIKWAVSLPFLAYCIFAAANLHATWYTMLPASLLLGLSAAILWPAKCTYLTELGEQYARWTGQDNQVVIAKFFCLFFMAFQSTQIWGNLISGFVLGSFTSTDSQPYISEISDAELSRCGMGYCSEADVVNNTNMARPTNRKIYTLCGTYMILSLMAFLTTAVCLGSHPNGSHTKDTSRNPQAHTVENGGTQEKPAKPSERKRPCCHDTCVDCCQCHLVVATVRHWRYPKQLLLVPITVYSGLEQAFIASDFTKSYVSCSLGIWMVGMVFICFGLTNSLCSLLYAKLVRHTGRLALFVTGALLHLGLQVTVFLWQPHPDHLPVFFVITALWGAGDAVWQTMINALYGCVFPDTKPAAFTNYRLWESLGFIAAFTYSNLLCVYIKILVLMATLTLGMAGYLVVEWLERGKRDSKTRV